MRLLFLVLAFALSCFAEDIEIKGLKVGMKYEDVAKLYKIDKFENSNFLSMKNGNKITFGGVSSEFVSVHFKNKTVESIFIVIKSKSFDDVMNAIKTKYNLRCEDSNIKNRMGAEFVQVECNYEDSKSSIYAQKYTHSDISKSFIGIQSHESKQEYIKKAEESKKDI
ncbi:MAG: hypothetical protein ACMV1K_13450 [Sulfurospirillum sp.]